MQIVIDELVATIYVLGWLVKQSFEWMLNHVTTSDADGSDDSHRTMVRTNELIVIRIPCMIHLMAMGNLVPFASFFFLPVFFLEKDGGKGRWVGDQERSELDEINEW